MIKIIVSDFSRVLLLPKDGGYEGGLNKLHAAFRSLRGQYNIFDEFVFNDELFDFYRSLAAGYSLYIFTTGTIQNETPLREKLDSLFKAVYAANDLGWSKKDAQTYAALAEKIGVLPGEMLYIDDSAANVAAAATAGVPTVYYRSNRQAVKDIENTLGAERSIGASSP